MKFRMHEKGKPGEWYTAAGDAEKGWKLPYWAVGQDVDFIDRKMGHAFAKGTVLKADQGTVTIIGRSETAWGRGNSVTVWPIRRDYTDASGKVEATSFAYYDESILNELAGEMEGK